ncbi:c-type cytochrome domain-containing protein [Aeoliella sp.]|uniref:c-type cytochrome domain-containing protein n=1 Tax=Aeoliella sp. TaxID=2795800 RepID=UPI003CCBF731
MIFARRVLPILTNKCIACHGAEIDELAGGLNLTTRSGTFKGGDSGEAAVEIARPDENPLLISVRRERDWSPMPPKENDQLNNDEVAALHDRLRI